MTGVIACDIDGTLTTSRNSLPESVKTVLVKAVSKGWKLALITGRTFAFAEELASSLPFPFIIAVQNGATILEMPSRRILRCHYLEKGLIPKISNIFDEEPTDLVIYGGREVNDRCYYCPNGFHKEMTNYVQQRKVYENWLEVNHFNTLPIERFTSFKFFGELDSLNRITESILFSHSLNIPIIKDPFIDGYYVAQATHLKATKGEVIQTLRDLICPENPIIACGDDENDLSMLSVADVSIVMANAKAKVLQEADLIAPPASKNGIVKALEEVI